MNERMIIIATLLRELVWPISAATKQLVSNQSSQVRKVQEPHVEDGDAGWGPAYRPSEHLDCGNEEPAGCTCVPKEEPVVLLLVI